MKTSEILSELLKQIEKIEEKGVEVSTTLQFENTGLVQKIPEPDENEGFREWHCLGGRTMTLIIEVPNYMEINKNTKL